MPLHFLWGDEDFLIEKALLKIKKEILKDDINELNYKSVDNPSFSLFSELLRTNAMMFGDVVIKITCPKYFLETKTKVKLDDKQTNELISALNMISDRVHIVLICPTPRGEKKKPDSRKKLYKEVIKLTKPEEFTSFKGYEEYKMIPVVKKMASDLKLKINQEEISFLIRTTGTSLRDINNQLEKLKLVIYPKDTVSFDDINENALFNADIFNFVDLILNKKYLKALDLISEILQKEHYLPSLAFIQTTFSNLLKIKIYSNKMSTYDIAIKLNQNEYVVKKNMEKLNNVDINELVRIKLNLLKMEYNLKNGTIQNPILGYESAFFEGMDLC